MLDATIQYTVQNVDIKANKRSFKQDKIDELIEYITTEMNARLPWSAQYEAHIQRITALTELQT